MADQGVLRWNIKDGIFAGKGQNLEVLVSEIFLERCDLERKKMRVKIKHTSKFKQRSTRKKKIIYLF